MSYKMPSIVGDAIFCSTCGLWRKYPEYGGYINAEGKYYCGCRGVDGRFDLPKEDKKND